MSYQNAFTTLNSKKVLIQFYFIFFILLNIFDFLNLLSGDIDFFKKLLSWGIIGYIFYKASFSKIFIGERHKNYDLLFILAFSLISITKSILLYSQNNPTNQFIIFKFFFNFISDVSLDSILWGTFVLGFVLTLVLCIALIANTKTQKDSFIASWNIKEGYFKSIIELSILILVSLFFGFIVFNFFMEWFALAVDSIILVLGFLYYTFAYIHHHHSNSKLASITNQISNTGNSFYSRLISLFSDKKTFFIAISFLLTLHLLVDAGVYLVPYTIGTENTLYFESLNVNGVEHIPLLSVLNFEDSRLYEDLENINFDPLLSFGVISIYFLTLFIFFVLMVSPFYIFYNLIQKNNYILPKIIGITFLTSLIFILTLYSLPGIEIPLKIHASKSSNIGGVDISTSTSIVEHSQKTLIEILSADLLFLVILSFLIFRYEKYKVFFDKIIYFSILVFFCSYILMFYYNSIIVDDLTRTLNQNIETANEIEKIYSDPSFVKAEIITAKTTNDIKLSVELFSDMIRRNLNEEHNEFIKFEIIGGSKETIKLNNPLNTHMTKEMLNSYKKNNEQISFYVPTNKNYFQINNNEITPNYSELTQITKQYIIIKEESYLSKIELFNKNLRIILNSFFYIFGTLAFSIFFIKNRVWISSKDKFQKT